MKVNFYDVKLKKKVEAEVVEVNTTKGRSFAYGMTEDGRRLCTILSKAQAEALSSPAAKKKAAKK